MTTLRRILIALASIAVVSGVIILALGQYQQYRDQHITAETISETENPDIFLDQSLTTIYRDNGEIDYQFNGEYLEHFKQADIVQIKMVYFIFFGRDGLTWHARADRATFVNKSKKITLNDNVRIWRPERNMELTTSSITFNEAREYADTDSAVTIKSPAGITHSVGMKLDLNRENLQLLSKVTGLYHVKR